MEHIPVMAHAEGAASLAGERPRLVALCARMSGDPVVAEDLAQEALLEAWRHLHTLRDPEHFAAWLAGIARNVCRRWAQRRPARQVVTLDPWDHTDERAGPRAGTLLADTGGVEIELERRELAELLDRALTLLPEETRAALLAHYIEGRPVGQIAERLGLSAGAVTMRLQRGKLALRRALTNELAGEAAGYVTAGMSAGWEETRLWCVICGRRRLQGRYHAGEGELWLRCPGCEVAPTEWQTHTRSLDILGGVRGYKRAHDRVTGWIARYYPPNLRRRAVRCMRCGAELSLSSDVPADVARSPIGNDLGLSHYCAACDSTCWVSLDGLLLASPAGRAFARRHERIRTLPYVHVEAEGRPAVVARFESVVGSERLALVADAETFELLRAEDGRA